MKLGFLQGGMPAWTNAEIARQATELGCDGVGIGRRNLQGGSNASDEEVEELRRTYAAAGVEIHNFSADTRPLWPGIDSDEIDWDAAEVALVSAAKLTARVGSPSMSVTVQQPNPGTRTQKWNWDDYLENLGRVSLTAVNEAPGVRAVFQNHINSANAQQLFEMAEKRGVDKLGVAFSPDHCIVMQENPLELANRHSAAIQHVTMADRKVVEEDLGKFDGRYYYVRYECCVVGEGAVPVEQLLETLKLRGFDGYVSLKWEWLTADPSRTIHPEGYGWHLPPGEVVLPPFVKLMKSYGVGERKTVAGHA
jgi:sugar phosphate isomerase/epimerase